MKKFLKVMLCFAVLAAGTSYADAQGLGDLLKKGGKKAKEGGKEVLGKIFGSEESAPEEGVSQVTETVSSSGITISNPVSSFVEIVPIGLYGVSKSENFGDVYLVLKVKNLIPKGETRFGSRVQNQNMIAVDNKGKVYNVDASGTYGYDTPEGIMIQVVLDEPGIMFTDVRKDVNMMQQVKFGVFNDAYHQGNVTLTNVPIYWDEVPE